MLACSPVITNGLLVLLFYNIHGFQSGLATHCATWGSGLPLGASFPVARGRVLTVTRHQDTHGAQRRPGTCFPFPVCIKKATWAFESYILVLNWTSYG